MKTAIVFVALGMLAAGGTAARAADPAYDVFEVRSASPLNLVAIREKIPGAHPLFQGKVAHDIGNATANTSTTYFSVPKADAPRFQTALAGFSAVVVKGDRIPLETVVTVGGTASLHKLSIPASKAFQLDRDFSPVGKLDAAGLVRAYGDVKTRLLLDSIGYQRTTLHISGSEVVMPKVKLGPTLGQRFQAWKANRGSSPPTAGITWRGRR